MPIKFKENQQVFRPFTFSIDVNTVEEKNLLGSILGNPHDVACAVSDTAVEQSSYYKFIDSIISEDEYLQVFVTYDTAAVKNSNIKFDNPAEFRPFTLNIDVNNIDEMKILGKILCNPDVIAAQLAYGIKHQRQLYEFIDKLITGTDFDLFFRQLDTEYDSYE